MAEHRVQIAGTDISFVCPEDQSVLDAALHAGVPLRYGCGHGECGTCRAQVSAGEYELWESVSPFVLLEHELDEGWTLLCSTTAYSDLEVDATLHDIGRPLISPQDYRLEVVSNTAASPGMHLLRATVGGDLRYYPGQYFELGLGEGRGHRRAYSFASLSGGADSEVPTVEFVVRLVPGGQASGLLAACVPGDVFEISAPYGTMTLREGLGPKVLVAGGSGIGPIRSIAQEILAGPPQEAVWLFHGSRLRDELLWYEELAAADHEYSWFHYVPVLSEQSDAAWSGRSGIVSEVLSELLDAEDLAATDCYVCGPGPMVNATRDALAQLDCPDDQIYADEF